MLILASQADFRGLELTPLVPPFMAACGIIGFLGLVCLGSLFSRRRRIWHGVVFVISLPFTGLVGMFLYALHQQDVLHPPASPELQREQHWQGSGSFISDMVTTYYIQHPERFHFPHGDGEAEVDGLSDFLRSCLPEPNDSHFSIHDGKLFSPFGDEVIVVVDRDHKSLLEARGKTFSYHWRNNVAALGLLRLAPDAPDPWTMGSHSIDSKLN